MKRKLMSSVAEPEPLEPPQFLVDKFTLLDPDPGGKMNADPCGSGSTALEKIYGTGTGIGYF